jgi:hypothetical protein
MSRSGSPEKKRNLGRHSTICKVCNHDKREHIEQEWISWGNTTRIAEEYGVTRDSLYRHAHACGLFEKRRQNVRKALERIIEHAESVEVNASAVVSAVQAYAKINDAGKWIERSESVNLTELFDKMSTQELEDYAQSGKLPDWFPVAPVPVATREDGPEGENDET